MIQAAAASPAQAAVQVFDEVRAAYQVSLNRGGATVVHLASGRNVVVAANVRRLRFADGTLVIDIDGNGGTVYRVCQAAFDRKPDMAGYGFWLGVVNPSQMLAMFSDGNENKAQVAPDIRNGIWIPAPAQSLDGMFRLTTRTTAVEVPPTHCVCTNCSASLYCEAPARLGEVTTVDLRIVLDAAQKKATLFLEKETVVGSYEPSANGPAVVRFDVVYPDEEVMSTPLTRYYSFGGVRLDLRYEGSTREISGTMLDRTSNRWTLDNHVATCTATSTVHAVPVSR